MRKKHRQGGIVDQVATRRKWVVGPAHWFAMLTPERRRISYHVMQFLTDHGSYSKYLHRSKLAMLPSYGRCNDIPDDSKFVSPIVLDAQRKIRIWRRRWEEHPKKAQWENGGMWGDWNTVTCMVGCIQCRRAKIREARKTWMLMKWQGKDKER